MGWVRDVLKTGPLLLALVFGAYAAHFLIATAFMPLLLVEEGGWSVAAAGMAGAAVIAANIIGCVASGCSQMLTGPNRWNCSVSNRSVSRK